MASTESINFHQNANYDELIDDNTESLLIRLTCWSLYIQCPRVGQLDTDIRYVLSNV